MPCPICGTNKTITYAFAFVTRYMCGYSTGNFPCGSLKHPVELKSGCICEIMLLMSKGCQCGQIQIEKRSTEATLMAPRKITCQTL